jgi:rhodanese-related sulfurtransferase
MSDPARRVNETGPVNGTGAPGAPGASGQQAGGSLASLDARGLPAGYPYRPEWEWTPRETRERLAAAATPDRPLLLDCRTEQERSIASIKGSLFVPLHLLELKLDEIREALEDAGQKAVVVHCHHGVRSLRATAILRAAGIDAHSLAGGIHLWSQDIDPSVPVY